MSSNCSRSWRKILNIREEARDFIHYKVETGEHIYVWLENWHPDKVLYLRYGHHLVYDAGSKLETKFSSMIRGKEWC